jgi:hypothetical protein
MNFLTTILYFIALLAITFGIMILGRKYVFSKVRVNKYVPLGIAIALIILQAFLPAILGENNRLISMVLSIVAVTFFLWFMDIISTGGPKKKDKQIEIRPKAKPNRVKHLKNPNNK